MSAGEGSYSDLTELTVAQLLSLLKGRRTSPVEVLDAHLARISAVNQSLKAIVTLCADEARATAQRLERDFRSSSSQALYGIPFTVKDTIATAGVRTTCGSRIFEHVVPQRDATAVARIKAAGAILLGKTNCPEFATDIQTNNLVFGETRNPLNPALTPGGSSGGESAAVASHCSPLGLGTDFGGSLRWPAQCTGINAIRPTPGRVPSSGRLPSLSWFEPAPPNSMTLDGQLHVVGPLARSVGDLRLVLAVLVGPDGIDAGAAPVGFAADGTTTLGQVRCGWVEGEGTRPVRGDLVNAVEIAASELQKAGAVVDKAEVPGLDRAERAYSAVRSMEGLAEVRSIVAGREDELSPMIAGLLKGPPPASMTEVALAAMERDAVRALFLSFFDSYDLLLLPVSCLPAFPAGQDEFVVDETPIPYWQVLASCRAVSVFGVPAAVVPCGVTTDGLPVGVQIVGPPYAEALVLTAAAALEQRLGGTLTTLPAHARS